MLALAPGFRGGRRSRLRRWSGGGRSLAALPAQTAVTRTEQRQGPWVQVRTAAGDTGWVHLFDLGPATTTAASSGDSSVVGGNANSAHPDISSPGTVNVTYSAIGSPLGFTLNGHDNLGFGANLKLGPLADNGGPTKTHALLLCSPCIDAGSNPSASSTDQRGFGRAYNALDIGAYELNPVTAQVVINGGDVQRSMVTSINITFSEPVTFPSGGQYSSSMDFQE